MVLDALPNVVKIDETLLHPSMEGGPTDNAKFLMSFFGDEGRPWLNALCWRVLVGRYFDGDVTSDGAAAIADMVLSS